MTNKLLSPAGAPDIVVTLRRTAQAKRLSLRVSRLTGAVTMTMPKRASVKLAQSFLDERAGWLRKQLSGIEAVQSVTWGTVLPFRGAKVEVVPGQVRRPILEGAQLILPNNDAMLGARVMAFLKAHARQDLQAATLSYAAQLQKTVGKITLKDTNTRWGSCSSLGNINYSWRLIMAPPEVLNYVAAHEVSHLVEMNHSAAYWAVVSSIYPDYQTQRDWLRINGDKLHKFSFRAPV